MTAPSDSDSLLAQAAAFGISDKRDLPCDGAEEALSRVLDAVQATVLPRVLTMHINGAPGPRLEIAGGRLVRVTGDLPTGFEDVAARDLSSGDAARLAELITAAVAGVARLELRVARPVDGSGTASGISPAQIGAALGFAPYGTTLKDRVADVLAAVEDKLVATVAPDGRTIEGVIPEAVAPFIAAAMCAPDGLAQNCARGEALFVEFGHPALGIGILPTERGTIAIVSDPGSLPDLAACWTETGGWGPVG